MAIPVSAMHSVVKDGYLSAAEDLIEADADYQHDIAKRDAVRLAYELYKEAGNTDIDYDTAKTNFEDGIENV